MSILAALFYIPVAIYRLMAAMWNASGVLLRVMQSAMQEAKQEAVELMALLDDGAPVMHAITSPSLLRDAGGPANPWQMLIIAKPSSFVLLLRLSKRRMLHLEVDENFVASKLEVIRTDLGLHVQHVPRMLQMPIGMHDTRLLRYTPTRLPYLWREERAGAQCGGGSGVAEKSIISVAPAAAVSTGGERAHRQKCVQLLTESAVRRRMHMDRVGRSGTDVVPKKGPFAVKAHGENAVKRKALANATNTGKPHGDGNTAASGALEEAYGPETGGAGMPKQAQMERNAHAALAENLPVSNMVPASSSRKMVESVSQSRRVGAQSMRRKRGQFDLYAQRATSEFSLLLKKEQERA